MTDDTVRPGAGIGTPTAETRSVPVWDLLVRGVHWSVAILFIANATLLEEGEAIHRFVGYAILTLVSLRLAWGIVGTRHARFSAFPPDAGAAIRDATERLTGRGRGEPHLSHNPLGALMAYALWTLLIAIALTGMALYAGWLPEEAGEELHETFANLALAAAALHVAGVVLESRASGVPLIRAMITGRKEIPPTGPRG